MICIRALQVRQGDSFLLSFQKENASQLLVIDSGYGITYPHFKQNLLEMFKQYNCKAQMFLTHVDLDHIGGYIRLFTDPEFQEYDRISAFYYNSIESLQSVCGGEFPDTGQSADIVFMNTNTGYKDAVKLETLLKVKGVPVEAGLLASRQIDLGPDIRTVILSPSRSSLVNYQAWAANKDGRHAVKLQTSAARYDYGQPLEELIKRPFSPDASLVNASSVSLLLEAHGRRLLFLGDAFPEDVSCTLRAFGFSEENRLRADLVKVSHHGSNHSTSPELLSLIEGDWFMISGNGTPGHPSKETLARILQMQDNPKFWFNYDIAKKIFTESEIHEFGIQAKCGMELMLE